MRNSSIIILFLFAGIAHAQSMPGELPRHSRSGGTIYRSLFDRQSDISDNDGWPDGWTRKEGFDNGIPFPTHLVIEIAENSNPFGNYCLRMNMEGGGAAVFSPKIPIRTGMSYTVSTYVETDDLVFDNVSMMMVFYGKNTSAPIRTITSPSVRNTNGWRQLSIGPIIADMPGVSSLAIGLLVLPDNRQDYGSHVHFTNVEIRESPTVSLDMANDDHLFFNSRELDVRCKLQGLDPAQHSVLFSLEDPFGQVIAQREIEMMIGNRPASKFVVTDKDPLDVIEGVATWQNLPIISHGFYRVRVAMPESFVKQLRLPGGGFFNDPLHDSKPLTFAVMPTRNFFPGGEFGWNLDGWSLSDILRSQSLLSQSGLSNLKIPAWFAAEDSPEHRHSLNDLCNRLMRQQVHLIGLLNPIPPEMRNKVLVGDVDAAALMSADPAAWGESLQPSLQSLSLLVKDWQWTSDTDQSLVNLFFETEGASNSGLLRFNTFRQLFDQHDFGFGIGLTWDWNRELPNADLPANFFTVLPPAEMFFTPEHIAEYFAQNNEKKLHRAVSISPLPEMEYALDYRIIDLVKRMVLLKSAGIESIFLTKPKDNQIGVLREDGTPSELYLPWRTTATQLSVSPFLGSVTFPNRSTNYCFDAGGGKSVMVVWNDQATDERPIMETLYLGAKPEIVDVWGKHTVPDQRGTAQTIPVTAIPVFVTGLNTNLVRYRLNFQTETKSIPSVPNQKYPIAFSFTNSSAFPVSVQITPTGPRPGDWTITPPTQTMTLEPGAAGKGTFDLTLAPRANTGRRSLRYDVKIAGAEPMQFSVFDDLQIGDPNVYMEFVSRLNPRGDIEVIQTFVNNSENVYTYDCRLTVTDRPPQKTRINRRGFGRWETAYIVRRGKALLDAGVNEMTVRAQPLDGGNGLLGQPMIYTVPLVSE